MKRIVHLTAVVAFACLLIAFYATNVTTYASEKSDNECELCGKPSDSHGKPVTIEQDGENLTFCCQGCVNKYEKEHQDKSYKEEGHPGKHKGDDKH